MKNLKYSTNGLIYRPETDGQTERTDLCLPSGRASEGGTERGAGGQVREGRRRGASKGGTEQGLGRRRKLLDENGETRSYCTAQGPTLNILG